MRSYSSGHPKVFWSLTLNQRSAFIIHYMTEGAITQPALHSTARMLFLLNACKGQWDGEINGQGVGGVLILASVHFASHPAATLQLWWPLCPKINRGEFHVCGKGRKRKISSLQQRLITRVSAGSAEAALWERMGPWPDQTAVALNSQGTKRKEG